RINQRANRMAADVTCTPGDQYCHGIQIRIVSALRQSRLRGGMWSELVAGSLQRNDGNGV
ncbi:MAG: hypothetical protein IKF65_05930, partial [Clostridia bacterium]|nr:hypothetical protein [Clostridia bacterium]